jgi:hypothetical protein
MNPIREWIETMLRISRDQAEYGEFDRKIQRLLFLFAIEIGRGKRLTVKERDRYAKSMLTAEAFLAITERYSQDPQQRASSERLMSDCVANWQKHEPQLRRILERLIGSRFQAFDVPVGMWPEMRDMIAGQLVALARAYPEHVPPSEIPALLDRLNHPLDRA